MVKIGEVNQRESLLSCSELTAETKPHPNRHSGIGAIIFAMGVSNYQAQRNPLQTGNYKNGMAEIPTTLPIKEEWKLSW